MALSKISPDPEKVEEAAARLKEIIETTWLRDPKLNDDVVVEFNRLKEELEGMGLTVTWNTNLLFDGASPSGVKLQADVDVWIPKSTTIH